MKYSINKLLLAGTIAMALLATGCKNKKHQKDQELPQTEQSSEQSSEQQETVQPKPAPFVTMQSQRGKLTVNMDGNTYSSSASVTMVWDSLIVLSVKPLVGIELLRAEATPSEVVLVDKINKRYVRMSYADASAEVGQPITFAAMQELLVRNIQENKIALRYPGSTKMEVEMLLPDMVYNQPVNTARINLSNYKRTTLSAIMQSK